MKNLNRVWAWGSKLKACLHRLLSPEFPIFDDQGVLVPPDAGSATFNERLISCFLGDRKENQGVLMLASS